MSTPLYAATERGDAKAVQRLLNQVSPNEGSETRNWMPLHEACLQGLTEIAEKLIDAGADVNAVIHIGMKCVRYTPLHFAAEGDHYEIAQKLITAGADRSATNIYGQTPLGLAKTTRMINLLSN